MSKRPNPSQGTCELFHVRLEACISMVKAQNHKTLNRAVRGFANSLCVSQKIEHSMNPGWNPQENIYIYICGRDLYV